MAVCPYAYKFCIKKSHLYISEFAYDKGRLQLCQDGSVLNEYIFHFNFEIEIEL
jgi:hypothetical protein